MSPRAELPRQGVGDALEALGDRRLTQEHAAAARLEVEHAAAVGDEALALRGVEGEQAGHEARDEIAPAAAQAEPAVPILGAQPVDRAGPGEPVGRADLELEGLHGRPSSVPRM